jgi:hypothetical protein
MDPRDFLTQLIAMRGNQGTPSIQMSGRQSGNVEFATPAQQAAPTLAELSQLFVTPEGHKYPAPYVSNWDVLHKRHLMDPTPLAQHDFDVPTTQDTSVLSQQIQPPGAPGFVQNPGTFIPAQRKNRQIQDTSTGQQLPEQPTTPGFSAPVLPANTDAGPFRPGLRYAPWNLRQQ